MNAALRLSDDGLKLPIDWMLNATVVYGARGSGKTVFNCVVAEEVAKAKQRFCAIDLKGDFYGLKSSADGKSAALPIIIFGGDHADVPLEPEAGDEVGQIVAGLEQSCVLDLEHMSKGKQVRFLAAFFASLYHHNRKPLLLLLDECQRYAPQKPIDPDAAKCLGMVEDLVKLGRKHAIGVVLSTQRGAGLNKEVAELADLLVVFRTPGPLDQSRVEDWLYANTTKAQAASVMSQLSGLPTGSAVFASGHPKLKLFGVHQVRMRETFDSSATPKIGQRRREPKMLAKADLTALQERMKDAIERKKAEDPKALRAELAAKSKRVAELELELQRAKDTKPAGKERVVEKPVLQEKQLKTIDGFLMRLEKIEQKSPGLIETVKSIMGQLNTATLNVLNAARVARAPSARPPLTAKVAGTASTSPRSPAPPRAPARAATRANGAAAAEGALTGGELAVMKAVAMYPDGIEPEGLSVLTGYTRSSRNTFLQRLGARGFIERRGSTIRPTDAGIEGLGSDFEPLPTGEALREWWLGRLGEGGERRTLEVLIAEHPAEVPRDQLQESTGYTRSSSNTFVQRLGAKQLVMTSRDGVRASDNLFG